MTLEIVSALAVFAFVFSVTPGPNNLMLLASGTNYGFQATLPHMLGVNIGFMVMIFLVGIGIMRVMEVFPVLHIILKTLCVIYLLYLSWRVATASPASEKMDQGTRITKPFTFIQAALFQWVNPKAWTLALAVVSTYVPPLQPLMGILLVVLVCGTVNLPSILVWVVMGTQLRKILDDARRLRVFNRIAAGLLVCSLYPVLFVGQG